MELSLPSHGVETGKESWPVMRRAGDPNPEANELEGQLNHMIIRSLRQTLLDRYIKTAEN